MVITHRHARYGLYILGVDRMRLFQRNITCTVSLAGVVNVSAAFSESAGIDLLANALVLNRATGYYAADSHRDQ